MGAHHARVVTSLGDVASLVGIVDPSAAARQEFLDLFVPMSYTCAHHPNCIKGWQVQLSSSDVTSTWRSRLRRLLRVPNRSCSWPKRRA